MSKTPEFMLAMDNAELEKLWTTLDRDVKALLTEGHSQDYVIPDSPDLTLGMLMSLRYLAIGELGSRDQQPGEAQYVAMDRVEKRLSA